MVHSLAKWKRWALARYGFEVGEGLYTDMDAIRKDEGIDISDKETNSVFEFFKEGRRYHYVIRSSKSSRSS